MSLRKWRTNSEQFHATIPTELVETADLTFPAAPCSQKALGLHWQVASDTVHVATPSVPPPAVASITMHTVASVAAQVYDVLGFFAPFIITSQNNHAASVDAQIRLGRHVASQDILLMARMDSTPDTPHQPPSCQEVLQYRLSSDCQHSPRLCRCEQSSLWSSSLFEKSAPRQQNHSHTCLC